MNINNLSDDSIKNIKKLYMSEKNTLLHKYGVVIDEKSETDFIKLQLCLITNKNTKFYDIIIKDSWVEYIPHFYTFSKFKFLINKDNFGLFIYSCIKKGIITEYYDDINIVDSNNYEIYSFIFQHLDFLHLDILDVFNKAFLHSYKLLDYEVLNFFITKDFNIDYIINNFPDEKNIVDFLEKYKENDIVRKKINLDVSILHNTNYVNVLYKDLSLTIYPLLFFSIKNNIDLLKKLCDNNLSNKILKSDETKELITLEMLFEVFCREKIKEENIAEITCKITKKISDNNYNIIKSIFQALSAICDGSIDDSNIFTSIFLNNFYIFIKKTDINMEIFMNKLVSNSFYYILMFYIEKNPEYLEIYNIDNIHMCYSFCPKKLNRLLKIKRTKSTISIIKDLKYMHKKLCSKKYDTWSNDFKKNIRDINFSLDKKQYECLSLVFDKDNKMIESLLNYTKNLISELNLEELI